MRRLPTWFVPSLVRLLCALSVLAAVWAAVVAWTGGFRVEVGTIRVSSRHASNPGVVSLASALVVWLLSFSPEGRRALHRDRSRLLRGFARARATRWRQWPAAFFAALPLAVAIVGIGLDISQWARALPLWVDEEMIALNLRDRSLVDLAGPLWLGQSAPLGWLVLERFVMDSLGTGERALRFLPLLFGMATVTTALWVGRRWMGPVAATVFVFLCWIGRWPAHYRFEVKHYTADVLFGLLIPVLAAWAIEAVSARDRARRARLWWGVGAVGLWFANGALLVTPACALFLLVALWRRDGRRAAVWFSSAGLVWLTSFGLYYVTSAQHTLDNRYLHSIWAQEMLPLPIGVIDGARWFIDRLEPLALNPGGTAFWLSLWASAVCGLLWGVRGPLGSGPGLALACVPPSAFAFAAVVPLHQRFSIWIVPALYAGVAFLIDRAVGLGAGAFVCRRWAHLAFVLCVLVVQGRLCADIYERGRVEIESRRYATDKHQLDDRAAVRWLMSQWEPGDALMTTRLASAAVWWYGEIPISDEAGAGGVLRDGSPVYEVGRTSACPSRQVEEALANRRRVLLYLGFDVDPGFDEVLLGTLGRLGGVISHREFSTLGRAVVIDLGAPPSDRILQLARPTKEERAAPEMCVAVRPARRW